VQLKAADEVRNDHGPALRDYVFGRLVRKGCGGFMAGRRCKVVAEITQIWQSTRVEDKQNIVTAQLRLLSKSPYKTFVCRALGLSYIRVYMTEHSSNTKNTFFLTSQVSNLKKIVPRNPIFDIKAYLRPTPYCAVHSRIGDSRTSGPRLSHDGDPSHQMEMQQTKLHPTDFCPSPTIKAEDTGPHKWARVTWPVTPEAVYWMHRRTKLKSPLPPKGTVELRIEKLHRCDLHLRAADYSITIPKLTIVPLNRTPIFIRHPEDGKMCCGGRYAKINEVSR
jgi:hypothetical protein